MDKHTLALISVIGSSLDVLGTLYLAYDLLGGEHGPLRVLTRAVTYGLLFGAGFAFVLGPLFGLAAGVAHGATLAWEFSRASRHKRQPNFLVDTTASAIRGLGFTVGAAYLFGPPFGITFGLLSAGGQIIAYSLGIRPTMDYEPAKRLRITWRQFLAALNRTVGYTAAGYLSSLVARHREHALAVGLETGLAVGLVTVLFSFCVPLVEWMADRIPPRSMGVFGIALILAGFGLQSVQYWLALLDISVR